MRAGRVLGGPEYQFNIQVIFSALANASTVSSIWSPVTNRPRFPTMPILGEPTTGGLDVIGWTEVSDVTEGEAMASGLTEGDSTASGVTEGMIVASRLAVAVVLGETTAKVFGVEAGTTMAIVEDGSPVEGPSVRINGVDDLETAFGVADWPAVTVTVTTSLSAVTVTVADPQELDAGVVLTTCLMTGDKTGASDSSGDSVFERAGDEAAPGTRRVRVATLVRRTVVRVPSPAFPVRMAASVAFLVPYGVTMAE